MLGLSFENLKKFAQQALFPSHALIIRPNIWNDKKVIFKGIQSYDRLEKAFQEALKSSWDGKVWVETDMRAHMNPTRMQSIVLVADLLTKRLATECPKCTMPGWGEVSKEHGLPCELCGTPTLLTKGSIYGCVSCSCKKSEANVKTYADALFCPSCNP